MRELVTVEEVQRHPEWRRVDCRFTLTQPEAGRAAFEAGHLPGAQYADLDRDLAGPRTPGSGRHPLPSPEQLVRLFSGWGIGPGTGVVAYDEGSGAMAARLWWLLRYMGHRHVALLDGGLAAWTRAGLPLENGPPAAVSPASFRGRAGAMPVMDTAAVESALADGSIVLLDARTPERFRGEVEPIDPVAGRVPGAVNAPLGANLAADGRFRSPEELSRHYRALLGDRAPAEAVCMCGSGVTACHDLFALELAGLRGARLWPGSYSEWVADARRPVARG